MKYISSRGNHNKKYSASQAIKEGMVPGGGLFIPEIFPHFPLDKIDSFKDLDYRDLSLEILKEYLSDYSEDEIRECIFHAYSDISFPHREKTPVIKLKDDLYTMELWHGPTGAFKDMALQLMPRLFVKAREKTSTVKDTLILVATSGDTGKAALEGFKDLEGIKLAVFYPEKGVSEVQRLQMATSKGDNVHVSSVMGNFDDCQTEVKNIFSDTDFNSSLEEVELSSANSINLGRLLPQIIYYFKAYSQLLRDKEITLGEKVDFSVPTGNFGNILAGFYALKMGLPIGRLICASNKNNILSDFFKTGIYDKNRAFHRTISPSMDILVSSNLERFLYHILGDPLKVSSLYDDFRSSSAFSIDNSSLEKINSVVTSGYATEDQCLATIRSVYDETSYPIDTHTAVAMSVALEKKQERKVVVLSTASIYKFPSSVLKGLGGKGESEFQELALLNKLTRQKVHRAVTDIDKLDILHSTNLSKGELRRYIQGILK